MISSEEIEKRRKKVKIPKLDNGRYLFYAEYENDEKTFAFSAVQVTDFALVQKKINSNIIYQIIDRNNGQPITDATVKISYQIDYRSRFHTLTETTDVSGEVLIIKTKKRWTNIKVEVSKDGQTGHFGNYYINRYYDNDNEEFINYNVFLFTDRSIYRPGQTVYLKGISLKREEGKSQVYENDIVEISLYNTNDDEVSNQKFKTNYKRNYKNKKKKSTRGTNKFTHGHNNCCRCW